VRAALLRLFDWLGKYQLTTLILVGLLAAGLWAFAELADEMLEGETHALDRAILLSMRKATDPSDPLGPPWFEEAMRDITAFGSIAWLSFVTLATLGYLALRQRTRELCFVATAMAGGWILSTTLKWIFSRPRPELVPHGARVYSASFPSGHSLMAAVTYLTLAALLARVQAERRLKAYLLLLGIVLTLLTGISRVYLGVHWPTDVLAGWVIGASWAILCWLVARWLERGGHLNAEQSTEQHMES